MKDTPQSNTDWRNAYPLSTFTGRTKKELEEFISQLLEAEKKRWREEVESMKVTVKDIHPDVTLSPLDEDTVLWVMRKSGYNQAINAILQKLS